MRFNDQIAKDDNKQCNKCQAKWPQGVRRGGAGKPPARDNEQVDANVGNSQPTPAEPPALADLRKEAEDAIAKLKSLGPGVVIQGLVLPDVPVVSVDPVAAATGANGDGGMDVDPTASELHGEVATLQGEFATALRTTKRCQGIVRGLENEIRDIEKVLQARKEKLAEAQVELTNHNASLDAKVVELNVAHAKL